MVVVIVGTVLVSGNEIAFGLTRLDPLIKRSGPKVS